ncbi:hypothetical protein OF376_01575 [Ureaplasma miroungigenitalium]|uniref:DNA polymerase III subunit delta n=1 Tax=Ureaplasma miroungigenitalium TaxID=1042321 RepID=A0ABT3BMK0_9BACT|nr:hypothetical protein [Ureaplasma miroungigenitalium]MCV3728456.1 hypothetical protein [Ureaplasma miroungigenitalium]MCV3734243.1 hypothetical protein [Ureaplasma miroungigenitalium]
MHHANLLIINSQVDYLQAIKEKIISFWKEKSIPNLTEYINKLTSNNYADLLIYDGSKMKKQDSLDLQNRFLTQGLEALNDKFYIIVNIDQTSSTVCNSLLKFIEQPPLHTYGFFTTNQLNAVLQTITSRCSIQNIKSHADTQVNPKLLNVFNDYLLYQTYNQNKTITLFEDWVEKVADPNQFNFLKQEFKNQTNEVLYYFLRYCFYFLNLNMSQKNELYEWINIYQDLNFNKTSLLALLINLFY